MRLPTFLVIGAMKAGTTSLHAYLGAHPQVFMAEKKEVDFFVPDESWRRGVDWYATHFAGATDEIAVGEASPRYTYHPHWTGAAERIAATLDRPRLVYVLRHPVDRVRSMYLDGLASGWHREPIDLVLRDPLYIDGSRYSLQIDQYLPHIDRDQLLLVTAEDLRDRRADTMARIFAFIGVDPAWVPANIDVEMHRNEEKAAPIAGAGLLRRLAGPARVVVPDPARRLLRRAAYRPIPAADTAMPDEVRTEVLTRLRPDLERLVTEHRRDLGDDFDAWGLLD